MPSPLPFLLLAAPPALSAPAETPVVLDRVVAVVGDRIITASDVRLERALARRDPGTVSALVSRRRDDPLEALIDAAVIRDLAGDIAIYAPSTTDVQQRVSKLRASWEDPEDWRAFLAAMGLDEERLAGRIYSRMVVERYVYRNVGLAAETAKEGPEAAMARYLEWIRAGRAAVSIRLVAPQELP